MCPPVRLPRLLMRGALRCAGIPDERVHNRRSTPSPCRRGSVVTYRCCECGGPCLAGDDALGLSDPRGVRSARVEPFCYACLDWATRCATDPDTESSDIERYYDSDGGSSSSESSSYQHYLYYNHWNRGGQWLMDFHRSPGPVASWDEWVAAAEAERRAEDMRWQRIALFVAIAWANSQS